MAKALFFAHFNTRNWWKYIGSRLSFIQQSVLVSEFPPEGDDIYIVPRFLSLLERAVPEDGCLMHGMEACALIIRRCRLLRNLDRDLALRMIAAMTRVLREVCDQEQPDVAISFMVDYYVLDLLDRILIERGVRHVGLCAAVLDNMMMFTTRGEYTPVREPSEPEVERAITAITADTFRPFLPVQERYGLTTFLKRYTYFNTRAGFFRLLATWQKNPLNFHYSATHGIGRESRVLLKNLKVRRLLDSDWKKRLDRTPEDRRVFVALQCNPEATIDYWVTNPELIEYESVLDALLAALEAAGYHVFAKDHPNMFAYRNPAQLERLRRYGNTVLVPYEVSSQYLINHSRATFTLTGSVGLQASLTGGCAIVAEPYYYLNGDFLHVASLADLSNVPAGIAAYRPPVDSGTRQRRLARHVLRATVPGDTLGWKWFDAHKPRHVERTESLIRSLNEYVPHLIEKRADRAAARMDSDRP